MASSGSKANLIAAGVGAGLLAYASLVEPFAVQNVEVELDCPRLPAAFDGYRVLLLSDFHARHLGLRERRILEMVSRLPEHDLIAICGDLIHTPRGMDGMLRFVGQLHARDAVVATFGNSEHKNGVVPHILARRLTEVGVKMLINTSIAIERSGAHICIAGVDDPVSYHDDIDAALEDVPKERFKLLLMHTPDSVGLAVARGVDVILSGHTHGGQVQLPIVGAPFTHSLHGRRMSHGLYRNRRLGNILGYPPGRSQLYITRGIGISGLAVRFLCRPEITSITLRRRA